MNEYHFAESIRESQEIFPEMVLTASKHNVTI